MKRKSIVVLFIVLLLIGAGFVLWYQRTHNSTRLAENALWENYEVKQVTIENREYDLVVADTPERWQKGLMFVRKPVSGFDGMIFISSTYQYQRFWNMNTFEDLTLYWMEDEEVVGTSELPSIEKSKEIVRVSSPEPVNIVVEIIK